MPRSCSSEAAVTFEGFVASIAAVKVIASSCSIVKVAPFTDWGTYSQSNFSVASTYA